MFILDNFLVVVVAISSVAHVYLGHIQLANHTFSNKLIFPFCWQYLLSFLTESLFLHVCHGHVRISLCAT